MKQVEDLAVALVNLEAIEKCSSDKDSALITMVHDIRESLAKKFDVDIAELLRLGKILEKYDGKDS